jgi:hypothetical protein
MNDRFHQYLDEQALDEKIFDAEPKVMCNQWLWLIKLTHLTA